MCIRDSFTDGDGSYNDEAACFASKGWKVYTFGLGTAVDETVLQEIAASTGGSYRSLDSALNLTCEFQQVRAVIGGGTAQGCTPHPVPYTHLPTPETAPEFRSRLLLSYTTQNLYDAI